MISEDYDHRWEPLAEVHFNLEDDITEDNYIYCLCSRVFIRDGVKLYYVEKENGSESDTEAPQNSKSQEFDEHSHVHFSLDTSYKVKCEKDEGASCYCSASHTDNYCSTDEHDPAQIHGGASNALQPSDSGADLTYQECQSVSDNNQPETTTATCKPTLDPMDEDLPMEIEENYLTEDSWNKFWAVNGERLIWASWIKRYSDYINPAFLDANNDLCMDDNNVPKQHSADQICNKGLIGGPVTKAEDSIRERKFSYDSKVNPYKKNNEIVKKTDKSNLELGGNKDDAWLPVARRRSCSEHDRMLSPRTLATTDSMTNVTKITLSSYDVTSSHVTSESTPTDDYSVSSSTSDDQSNDQTRIANLDLDNLEQMSLEELEDTESYWQLLWKKHFGEQYAFHYANYLETQNSKTPSVVVPAINVEIVETKPVNEKLPDVDCENSEGNSQEMPSVIEIKKVEKLKGEEKLNKPRKKKRDSARYVESVGVLLQNLLKDEKTKEFVEAVEGGGDNSSDKKDCSMSDTVNAPAMDVSSSSVSLQSNSFKPFVFTGDGEEPPEEKPVSLKRSHENDDEEIDETDKIKNTFNIMGLYLHPNAVPKGEVVYRKRLGRLRLPRTKRFAVSKKTYFDEDGNACTNKGGDSQDDGEMQTDDDSQAKSDNETESKENNKTTYKGEKTEPEAVPLVTDLDVFGDMQEQKIIGDDTVVENQAEGVTTESIRRRRRKAESRRAAAGGAGGAGGAGPPAALAADPRLVKYWKKRHSLFHRFDEGIKLDLESWFSVTPEKVAKHMAERCRCDVIVDGFCGAGGNAIQFAWICERVIAIDIDPVKIEMARHNAAVYGVADRIEFIVGDFFQLANKLKADVVFLSPPWGGPKYTQKKYYDLETMLQPKPCSVLLEAAEKISHNIAAYLPRNSRTEQLVTFAKNRGAVEIEQNFLGRRYIALTAYYGDLVNY